jgi:hypothetical protein
MEDDQQNHNPAAAPQPGQHAPRPIYPEATSGPMAQHLAQPQPAPVANPVAEPVQDKYDTWNLIILGLLLLTFFSPLGSVLFLPIVVVGFFGALMQAQRHTKQPSSQSSSQPYSKPKGVAHILINVIVIICAVIGLGVLAIMGFLFILFSSGGGRMGS